MKHSSYRQIVGTLESEKLFAFSLSRPLSRPSLCFYLCLSHRIRLEKVLASSLCDFAFLCWWIFWVFFVCCTCSLRRCLKSVAPLLTGAGRTNGLSTYFKLSYWTRILNSIFHFPHHVAATVPSTIAPTWLNSMDFCGLPHMCLWIFLPLSWTRCCWTRTACHSLQPCRSGTMYAQQLVP